MLKNGHFLDFGLILRYFLAKNEAETAKNHPISAKIHAVIVWTTFRVNLGNFLITFLVIFSWFWAKKVAKIHQIRHFLKHKITSFQEKGWKIRFFKSILAENLTAKGPMCRQYVVKFSAS